MSHVHPAQTDQAELRAIISSIDRELASLSQQASSEPYQTTTASLRASWAELLKLLALAPAPALRVCPVCGHTGMRAATRCGYCWTELSPPKDGTETRRDP